jgi:hypothetical protein
MRAAATGVCAHPDCGGPLRIGKRFPSSGKRFGIEGKICCRCYQRLQIREIRAGRGVHAPQAQASCSACDNPFRAGADRYHGERFGFEGRICHACYMRTHNRRRRRDGLAGACDLCGHKDIRFRHEGSPWGIEGMVCGQCRDDLEEEQLIGVVVEPRPAIDRIPQALEVVGGEFLWSDLTPRAATRAILADPKVRRVFATGRAS